MTNFDDRKINVLLFEFLVEQDVSSLPRRGEVYIDNNYEITHSLPYAHTSPLAVVLISCFSSSAKRSEKSNENCIENMKNLQSIPQ